MEETIPITKEEHNTEINISIRETDYATSSQSKIQCWEFSDENTNHLHHIGCSRI